MPSRSRPRATAVPGPPAYGAPWADPLASATPVQLLRLLDGFQVEATVLARHLEVDPYILHKWRVGQLPFPASKAATVLTLGHDITAQRFAEDSSPRKATFQAVWHPWITELMNGEHLGLGVRPQLYREYYSLGLVLYQDQLSDADSLRLNGILTRIREYSVRLLEEQRLGAIP